MSLKAQITDDMKSAMKAGEKDRLKVVRLIMAAIKQVEVDTRKELDQFTVEVRMRHLDPFPREHGLLRFEQEGRPAVVEAEHDVFADRGGSGRTAGLPR